MSQDELLPFLATSDNRHPFFYNLHDFPVTNFNYLTHDNHSIDNSLELPPPLRTYAARFPQINSFDTISDAPLLTIPSASDVPLNTHKIGIHPILDPSPPPSLKNPITTQPSSSHSPHQYNTTSNSPPSSNPITTKPSPYQIHQTHSSSLF